MTHPGLKPHRHRPSQERKAIKAPIPCAWPGSTVVLIANGPSLTKPQVESARQAWINGRARVIGCNNAYQIAPWVDALYACDRQWWEQHIEAVRDVHLALLFSQDEKVCDMYGLWYVPSRAESGISVDSGCIHLGGEGAHSGFQQLNLAVHLGAKRILLLGYDCHAKTPARKHWFGNHAGLLDTTPHYDQWAEAYRQASPQLEQLGVEVINCTPDSAIDCFPRSRIGLQLGT